MAGPPHLRAQPRLVLGHRWVAQHTLAHLGEGVYVVCCVLSCVTRACTASAVCGVRPFYKRLRTCNSQPLPQIGASKPPGAHDRDCAHDRTPSHLVQRLLHVHHVCRPHRLQRQVHTRLLQLVAAMRRSCRAGPRLGEQAPAMWAQQQNLSNTFAEHRANRPRSPRHHEAVELRARLLWQRIARLLESLERRSLGPVNAFVCSVRIRRVCTLPTLARLAKRKKQCLKTAPHART